MKPYTEIMTAKEAQNREAWLKVRGLGIGGSDAATVLGLNPYKSALTLYGEKTGELPAEDISENPAVKAGVLLEPVVAKWFTDETGKKLARRGTFQSKEWPWMIANIDRDIVGEPAGLEIKTGGAFQKSKWEGDDIPDNYYCQCLHYMAVTGAEYWYIAALLGGQNFLYKRIDRNEEDIKVLVEEEKKFWDMVQDRRAPDPDGSADAARTLSIMYPGRADDTPVSLPEDAARWFRDYDRAKEDLTRAKNNLAEIENKIKAAMGDATVATIGDRKATWKASKPVARVSLSAIRKNEPSIYKALEANNLITVSDPVRRFRIY